MAKIQEELILYDRFSNTFTQYIRQAEQATKATKKTQESVERLSRSQRQAASASGGLSGSLKKLVGGFAALKTVIATLNLSDTLTSTKARLDMMNDGLQTTEQLQEKIYQSAQRSRGLYTETANFVAKLGNLAGDAFSSNTELIAFAEQINKQIVLSGATSAEASAAMLQLTQALSSGVLRGDELNSVLEQTPMIAKTIADYMGVTTGKMRELAAEGQVTAQVVKNAMLSAADETNKKFAQMPKTWGQRFKQLKNIAVKAFTPLLDAIGKLADSKFVKGALDGITVTLNLAGKAAGFAADNIDTIAKVAGIAAGAVLTYRTAVLWATIAQEGLNAALTANPLGLIITLVLLLAAAIMYLWDNCEGFRNFWTDMVRQNGEAWYKFYNNVFVPVANGIIKFINAISEGFMSMIHMIGGNPVAPAPSEAFTAGSFLKTKNGRVSGGFVIGENKEKPFGFKKLDETWLDDFNKNVDEAEKFRFKDYFDKMINGDWAATAGSALGPLSKKDDLLGWIEKNTKKTADSASKIEKAVNMTQEDIKSLVDVAERKYVNNINLTSQTPIINVNGANTGRTAADRQLLADAIRDILIEQTSAGSIRSTAQPVMG